MNLNKLQKQIMFEEGVKYEIYNDHLGYKTFGVGHLVRATDPENEMEVGTKVSKMRVAECFEADLYVAINDMEKFTEGMEIDDNIKECVTEMVFQLGLPRLNKFKNFKEFLS